MSHLEKTHFHQTQTTSNEQNVLAAGEKSKLTLENKVFIYKVIIKPVWIYRIQLWGSASNSNIEIQRFQSKTLRVIANAP